MGWIVFMLLIAGVGVAYYYLTEMEKDIRSELASGEPEPDFAKEQEGDASAVKEAVDSLESRICRFVSGSKGVLQTELYKEFPEFDRKLIQKALLDLDRSGKISRTKTGSTYTIT